MKQSDLKHWTWNEQQGWYETAHGAVMQDAASAVFFRTQHHLQAAELTEAARIAEHYEQTKQFAPDAEEPTMAQIRNWMSANGWSVRGVGPSEVCYWGPGRPGLSPLRVAVSDEEYDEDPAVTIDAISFITQRKREDIVREMVAL